MLEGSCQMRLKFQSGFPYTCSLPAPLCKLLTATTEDKLFLCTDCQLLAEDQGYIVREIKGRRHSDAVDDSTIPITKIEGEKKYVS